MNCPNCQNPIAARRNTKRYCSHACRQAAYMKRHFTVTDGKISVTNISVSDGKTNITPLETNVFTESNKPKEEIFHVNDGNRSDALNKALSILNHIMSIAFSDNVEVKNMNEIRNSITNFSESQLCFIPDILRELLVDIQIELNMLILRKTKHGSPASVSPGIKSRVLTQINNCQGHKKSSP
jgi:hypothetical protein